MKGLISLVNRIKGLAALEIFLMNFGSNITRSPIRHFTLVIDVVMYA